MQWRPPSKKNYLELTYLDRELRYLYVEEILQVTLYCPGKIRRYSGTAVMTIKESQMNIAEIQVLFRGNKYCQMLALR
jgi:hypothetical protein